MKRTLALLFTAALTGCGLSAGTAAHKISSGVSQCCASLHMLKDCPANLVSSCQLQPPQPETPAMSGSLVERSGVILTW